MSARRVLLFAFGFTAVWFTGFFPPANNPNELSRIEAIASWVESGTFSIDSEIPRLGDTMDKSTWNGHFYSNKAPGLIFAAVPVYRFLRIFLPRPRQGWSPIFILVRLATVSLASLLALSRFTRRLESGALSSSARSSAPLVAFAAAFGTPFLYYAHSFFSHAWAASLLFLAWELMKASEERPRYAAGLLAAAGLVTGWAAISEYTVAPIGAALAVRAAVGAARSRGRALFLFGAGAALPLSLLAAYDLACFGSPFRLSSACEAFPAYAVLGHRPLFGLGLPRPRAAWGILFSSSRGAIVSSPFWLWALAGWFSWWRARRHRGDCVFTLAALLLLWLPIAGYPNWEGGWSLGMRYLVPVLFFSALCLPWSLETPVSRGLFLAAVAFSAAFHVLADSSWPHFPASVAWPVSSVSAWLVAHGAAAPNLGLRLGWPPVLSLLPPVAVAAAALAAAARELSPSTPRRLAACALGMAIFAATLVVPPRLSSADARWRRETARTLYNRRFQ